MKANRRGRSGAHIKKLEPREHEARLNVQTAVEVIN